jgi:hypothetical protein
VASPSAHPAPQAGAAHWGPGPVLGVIAGTLITLVAAVLALAGLALVITHLVARDDDGYINTSTRNVATSSYALTAEGVELGDVSGGAGDWAIDHLGGHVRIRAELAGGGPVFVGIARERDLAAYLGGVPHDEIRDFLDNGREELRRSGGTRPPGPPGAEGFWVASATGRGAQTAQWKVTQGNWAAVVMNAGAAPGVDADVRLGGKVGWILWVGLALLAIGSVGVAGGVWAIRAAAPSTGGVVAAGAPAPAQPVAATISHGGPVRMRALLDEPLSRWLWLVKWALVIPHVLILAFLYFAFVVCAVISLVAVLFTGRYPRALFEFNVGVMRWGLRVEMYASGGFVTDRYPPFDLAPVPSYPVDLDIEYPEGELPRLRTVFQWLLAVPHYLVLGVLIGGSWWLEEAWVPGLLPLLVLFAAITLLFTGRYPRDIFHLVVGIHRWILRTVAYAAGMRPEYPPFTLDR